MSTAQPLAVRDRTRRQFERYPVPQRDPERDLQQMLATELDDLALLNQYCYRGRRDFRTGFRALVAGGGTGDAVVHLAHQLQNAAAEIVYLDTSHAAMEVAKARTRQRRFDGRIRWVNGSLLDLPRLDLGAFDYVNCHDVLHYLPDPEEGLAALASVLADDGAIGLSLHGRYGRTGIAHVQELLRMLDRESDSDDERVEHAKAVVGSLPATNWMQRALKLAVPGGGMHDADVVHAFLPVHDHVYSVLEAYDLVERLGLHLAAFAPRHRAFYDPESAFRDPTVRARVRSLPVRRQQAAAEITWGTITSHEFWVTRETGTRCSPHDPESVPFFGRFGRKHDVQRSILESTTEDWSIRVEHAESITVSIGLKRVPVAVRFVELVDDRRTLGEIVETIAADYDPAPPRDELWTMCRHLIDVLTKHDMLVFRHVSAPRVPTM